MMSSLKVMYSLFFWALLYDITQILCEFSANHYWYFSRRLIKPVDRCRGLFLQLCMAFKKKQTSKPEMLAKRPQLFLVLYTKVLLCLNILLELAFSHKHLIFQSSSQEKIWLLSISNIYFYLIQYNFMTLKQSYRKGFLFLRWGFSLSVFFFFK